jgi:NADH:ubiquinone oxidoreductase subunit F (NADH-binding)
MTALTAPAWAVPDPVGYASVGVGAHAGGLPGVGLPGRLPAPRPDVLRRPGAVLLDGVVPGRARAWTQHRSRYGELPALDVESLADAADSVGLRGFGGASFPTAVKLRSARHRRAPLVVVNGAEGEHASAKDGVLLRQVPHLVLDGALLAARALGTQEVTVRLAADRPDLPAVVAGAAAERGLAGRVTVSVGPAAFSAGEASAVVNALSGRAPVPAPLGRPPMTPSALPARRRPALVSNVETFARLALAARGMPTHSALLTVSGAVALPGVVELSADDTLGHAVAAVGGLVEPASAGVTGGWHGRWLPWTPEVQAARLTPTGLQSIDGRWGAGVLVLVPAAVCPLAVLASVATALAVGSAGQCGPCRSGLPWVAAELVRAARGRAPVGPAVVEVQDALASLRGRGLCAHPTAAADALQSGIAWAQDDLVAHRDAGCLATRRDVRGRL